MNFDTVYRKAGIRTINQFNSPPITDASDLKLIKDCIIHILPEVGGEYGPLSIEAITFELIKKNSTIFVDHLEDLKLIKGDSKILNLNTKRLIRDFHKRNKMFRLLRKIESTLTNNNTTILVNYCLLPHLFRPIKSPLNDYWLKFNIFKTLNENINRYSKLSNRIQLIEVDLPDTIKPLNEYIRLLSRNIRSIISEINEGDYWTIGLINFLLEERNEDFDLIGDFKNPENVVFYWNIDNRLIFLSLEKLIQLKEKNAKEAQKSFLNLIRILVEEQLKSVALDQSVDIRESEIDEPLENEIQRIADNMFSDGYIGEREKQRYIKLSTRYKGLDNPFGGGPLTDLAGELTDKEKELSDGKLVDLPTMVDSSMGKSTLIDYDKKYIKEIYQKDIANMILNFQRAGIAITNYEVVEKNDAATNVFIFKVQFTPINGKPSTVEFQLPNINPDGTFMANNVKNRMDKQRADFPIRKIRTNRVALTSYYGKLFIDRDSRGVNNYGRWITNKLISLFESDPKVIDKITMLDVTDINIKVPRIYSAIGSRISNFDFNGYRLSFQYSSRENLIGNEKLSEYERSKHIVCGKKGTDIITIDPNAIFYSHTKRGVKLIGTLNDLMDGKLGYGPVEFATMVNMGKKLSIGMILGYRYGITNLMKKLKVKYRIERKGRISEDEFVIKFSDSNLVVSKGDPTATMVLAGFNMYKKDIKDYNFGDFDHKDVYFNVFDNYGMTIRYLKEIDLIFQMFIDPITLELLKDIKEPTSIDGLLLRAVELLVTDDHPRETDMSYMRIRGYERLSGMVYYELIRSLRGFLNSPEGKERKISLNPRAVWLNVVRDPSLSQVNETNPIQNLKEVEKVSYSGIGGRDSKTMVRRTREFHPNDQGVVSESTTDNNKVGIITYLTADPAMSSIRGVTKTLDETDGTTRQLSTTFLVSPCSDRDEGKRMNFAGIQYTHTVAIEGNQIQPIRTGYESVIAHRSDNIYASVAKLNGVIIDVTENAVKVEYSDKTKDNLLLGKIIAKTPGMNITHTIITDREVGYKFKGGEVLCFNRGFFKRDLFNPTQVCFLMGAMANIALLESTDTLEDSCAISRRLSNSMVTKRTQLRNIIIEFEQIITSLVNVGDEVEPDSSLCIIADPVVGDVDIFDEESLQTLDVLAANAPKAKYKGIIEDIKILYFGKIEDMSESLTKLAKTHNKIKRKRVEDLNSEMEVKNNELKETILVEQNKLKPNTMIVQIYITNNESMGIGDKGVVGNQLKTIVGRIMAGINETESGLPIDALFGFQSIANRVVLAPQIAGTTTGALETIGKKASEIYFGE